MSMSDPLADMLSRIRNANIILQKNVDIPCSNTHLRIAEILKDEGYIQDFKKIEDNKQGIIRVKMKYDGEDKHVISMLKKVSKPGRRIYTGADDIPEVLGGLGISILSTSQGVMTGKEARKRHIGGEVLCYIA